jgi:hypothetical protein
LDEVARAADEELRNEIGLLDGCEFLLKRAEEARKELGFGEKGYLLCIMLLES